jgi:hypothetical protein
MMARDNKNGFYLEQETLSKTIKIIRLKKIVCTYMPADIKEDCTKTH